MRCMKILWANILLLWYVTIARYGVAFDLSHKAGKSESKIYRVIMLVNMNVRSRQWDVGESKSQAEQVWDVLLILDAGECEF